MDKEFSFRQWLKVRRKALDLTQQELAARVACSLVTIQKIEAGERHPSKQVAELLAEHLRVPLDERAAFVRFARARDEQPAAFPLGHPSHPWRTHERQRTNLPTLPSTLFGRDEELAHVKRRVLDDQVRLLTLLGPPGIGKTSLAVRAAMELLDEFDDGVYLVELAPITDSELVTATILRTLEVKESGFQAPLVQLKAQLADKRALLLLDNFEQVIAAAPMVADLLAACPWLRVIATSRAALHVRIERQWPLRPLPVPNVRAQTTPEELLRSPAVALFLDRAKAVQPDLKPTAKNVRAIATICARLDGLPLAIELIAARTNVLSPQAILTRLAKGQPALKLLTRGARDLPIRQRALAHAISWSYELLSADEQLVLARLGVFVGGCTPAAAEAICGDHVLASAKLRALLNSLVDKNLVLQASRDDQGTRFDLFNTIREFALVQLEASGEVAAARQRHAEYFLALAQTAERHLTAPEQAEWLLRLDAEQYNLRAALRSASESAQSELLLRLATALRAYWEARGDLSEGQQWMELALQQNSLPPNARAESSRELLTLRAKALQGAGTLAHRQGDERRTRESYEEALELFRKVEDRHGVADLLGRLGELALRRGEIERARARFEECIGLLKTLGDEERVAFALIALGHLAIEQGNYELATARFESSLHFHRAHEHAWGIANALSGLGDTARCQGEYDRALPLYEEALALLRGLGHKGAISAVLADLGYVARRKGDAGHAAKFFEESLALARELNFKLGIANCFAGLAGVATATGKPRRGARLLSAAQALLEKISARLSAADRAEWTRAEKDLLRRLDADDLPAAQVASRAMTVEQAIAYALTHDM